MHVKDKVIVVTGGAKGIGEAMCRRFVEEGCQTMIVADCDRQGAENVAAQIGAHAIGADVTKESDVIKVVKETEELYGRIDLFCSNAGMVVFDEPGGMATSCPNELWQKSWELHVMAHVYAARAVLPAMLARGEGYLLNTVSAAGLLNQIGSAPYSTSKHAAIGFAEALAITHGDDGIKVSVLCPQAVRTAMIAGFEDGPQSGDGILEPEDVAESVIQGLAEELFLILPHKQVKTYMQRKSMDYDRWLKGMRRLRLSILEFI